MKSLGPEVPELLILPVYSALPSGKNRYIYLDRVASQTSIILISVNSNIF